MNGIALAQALAGVGQGIKEGIKMSDARKAQQLNEMMVNQTIQKNDMLLAKERQDSMKRLQIEEMKRMAQYAGITGDMSKVNDMLGQMQAPFKFSDRAGQDGTINIVSANGEVLKEKVPLNQAINSIYSPVVGEDYPDYAVEQKRLNEEYKATQDLNKEIVKGQIQKEIKMTAPGESVSTIRKNAASAVASYANADKSNAEANKERVVTGIIEKTGRYPASGASKATGTTRPAGRRLGIQWK